MKKSICMIFMISFILLYILGYFYRYDRETPF